MQKSISFNLDSDGFISHECPKCIRQFKVKLGEGADGPIKYCPYCDHEGLDCWWTQAQVDYIEAHKQAIAGELFDGAFKGLNKPGSGLTYKPGPRISPGSPPPEPDNDWPIVQFASTERIKQDNKGGSLRCPVTGTADLVSE